MFDDINNQYLLFAEIFSSPINDYVLIKCNGVMCTKPVRQLNAISRIKLFIFVNK